MARKKKMPASIRVGGRNVSLVVYDGTPLNTSTMGTQNTWATRISLDGDLSREQQKATAVHELVHDIDAVTGVGMQERDVIAFSTVLMSVIRDNPDFLAWIQDESA